MPYDCAVAIGELKIQRTPDWIRNLTRIKIRSKLSTVWRNQFREFNFCTFNFTYTSHPQLITVIVIGEPENSSLSVAQMPAHTHAVSATSDPATLTNPTGNLFGSTGGGRRPITPYAGDNNLTTMSATSETGGPHPNMQPYLVLTFVIALQGVFPSRN